jgi:formate/nitrite transporter FocA (FNT family)
VSEHAEHAEHAEHSDNKQSMIGAVVMLLILSVLVILGIGAMNGGDTVSASLAGGLLFAFGLGMVLTAGKD